MGTWRLGANVDVIHNVTEATAAAVAPGAGRRHDCQRRRHDDGDSVMTHKEAQLGARWRRSWDRKTRSHGWIAMRPITQAQSEAQRPLSKTCAGHDASWTHRGTVTPPQGVARSRQVMPLDPCNRQGEWMKRGGTDNSRSWAGPQRLTQHTAHSARGRGSPKVSACVPHRSTTTTRWRRGPPSPHPEGTSQHRGQCQPTHRGHNASLPAHSVEGHGGQRPQGKAVAASGSSRGDVEPGRETYSPREEACEEVAAAGSYGRRHQRLVGDNVRR